MRWSSSVSGSVTEIDRSSAATAAADLGRRNARAFQTWPILCPRRVRIALQGPSAVRRRGQGDFRHAEALRDGTPPFEAASRGGCRADEARVTRGRDYTKWTEDSGRVAQRAGDQKASSRGRVGWASIDMRKGTSLALGMTFQCQLDCRAPWCVSPSVSTSRHAVGRM